MYGIAVEVPAPIEVYDAMHAELHRTHPEPIEGLLLHVARPTDGGFEVLEVWESPERYEHYQRTLVQPMSERLFPGTAGEDQPRSEAAEFEVRGLVIPGAGVHL